MMDYNKIMTIYPVHKFIRSNFKPSLLGYKNNYDNSLCCAIYMNFFVFKIDGNSINIGLDYSCTKVLLIDNSLDISSKIVIDDIHSDSDLFAYHISNDLFGMDYNFIKYAKDAKENIFKNFNSFT